MMTIPEPKTRFIGRSEDLARLAALCASGARIVTLWGPPGIGKTRLAIELCRQSGLSRAGRRANRWFVDLTLAREPSDICSTVMRSVHVGARSAVVSPEWVGAALAGCAPGVLVLDNFEQLTAHSAETVGAWSEMAPEICFVITSRERLRLAGEHTHEVLPLGPEGAELFLDRARAVVGAAADAMDAESVADVVCRLDGIPLVIELAAARTDLLGIEGLLARLAHPLDLLSHGVRDARPNHTALRQAVDASFRLLGPVEQQAFAQCAVFRGGFSLEAAEAVIALPAGALVLDVLQALRDRSLLRCLSEGGGVRFALLEPIRAYALDVLSARGEATDVKARHAEHYLDPRRDPQAADHGNLAEAASFVLADEATRSARARDILTALARVEPVTLSDTLLGLLGQALEAAEQSGLTDASIARALRTHGRAMLLHGFAMDARRDLERALLLASDDPALSAELWIDLGILHHQCRDMDRARACYETALTTQMRLGDRAAEARCLGNIGTIDHDLRRYDAAVDHYERALAIFREIGDRRLEGIFLTNSGVLLQERGASARARSTYVRALEALADAHDARFEAITHTNLGLFHHELGELDRARQSHELALARFREIIDPRSEGLCLGRLAMVEAALGRSDEARAHARRAERLIGRLDDRVARAVLRLFAAYLDVVGGAGEPLARARIADARSASFAGGSSLVDLSDDARAAIRLIETAIAATDTRRAVLVVGSQGQWFAPPGGAVRDLGGRWVLRRLLCRLIEQHREAPGEGLTLDALREAGWPGERLTRASAANRVHVALTELRRRGLKACLLRRHDRYLIDPALRVDLRDGPRHSGRPDGGADLSRR